MSHLKFLKKIYFCQEDCAMIHADFRLVENGF